MKLILAHESRAVRSYLRAALSSSRVASAPREDVSSAAELLRGLQDDLEPGTVILLDWNLPGLDVPTFLAHLDGAGLLGRASVLVLANRAQAAPAADVVRRRSCGLLVRPFSDEDLIAAVEALAPAAAEPASDVLSASGELPSLLSLPSALLSRIFKIATRTRHEPGARILRLGEPVEALSFVMSGEVEVDSDSIRGAGECFAEHAFICGELSDVDVRALGTVEIASIPRDQMVDLARRHPTLKDFLTLLLTRPEAAPAGRGSELAGTVASLSFFDLIQYLNATRKSGVLHLEEAGRRGRISFDRGEMTDARTGDEAGEPAFLRMASWKTARFDFRSGTAPATRTLHRSTLTLLFSAHSAEPSVCSKVG